MIVPGKSRDFMLFSQSENLLPKRLSEGVALNHFFSQHQLSKVRGSRKLIKIVLGVFAILYFSGYQPTLAIPPIKQAVVEANFSQAQDIQAATFPEAFILPHPGYISTRFSSWHPGMDIATGLGMPIHPIASGKVAEVTYGFFGLGHSVIIEHAQGFKSTYGHMGKIFVKVGDNILATSTLGEVGMTGRTTGPHTHLEITKDGQYIDPINILPTLADWPTDAGNAPKGEGETKVKEKPKIVDPVTQLFRPLQPTPAQSAVRIVPSLY